MKIQVINGPNLNLLGIREKEVYGSTSFEKYLETLKKNFKNTEIDYFQSNIEGELIDCIQNSSFTHDGIILNAGGYTHTSVALHDAIKAVNAPVVEVHISNTQARENFRHKSLIAPACIGIVAGFGLFSYNLAIMAIEDFNNKNK